MLQTIDIKLLFSNQAQKLFSELCAVCYMTCAFYVLQGHTLWYLIKQIIYVIYYARALNHLDQWSLSVTYYQLYFCCYYPSGTLHYTQQSTVLSEDLAYCRLASLERSAVQDSSTSISLYCVVLPVSPKPAI